MDKAGNGFCFLSVVEKSERGIFVVRACLVVR